MAYPFDSAQSRYINYGTSSTLKPTSAISWGYWYRTSTSNAWVLSNMVFGTYREGYSDWIFTSGRCVPMICQTGFGSNGTHYRVGHTNTADGAWHHHAVTWTANSAVKIYVDGVEDTYDADYPGGSYPSAMSYGASSLNLGLYTPSTYYATGDMADWFLCNVALTAAEVAEIYHRRGGWEWARGLLMHTSLVDQYGVNPSTDRPEFGNFPGTMYSSNAETMVASGLAVGVR